MNKLTWLEIDKKNILYNISNIKSLLQPKTRLMVVVKSNAYGHGMVEFAKEAVRAGALYLGVNTIDEALTLRKSGIIKPILVMGYVPKERILEASKQFIDISILSSRQAVDIINEKLSLKLKIHIKVDTGLNRLGINPDHILNIYKELSKYKKLEIVGIYSHLSAVEESNMDHTASQFKVFGNVIKTLEKNNISIPIKHIAASSATLILPESHFDMVRVGIANYGLWPSEDNKKSFFDEAPIDIKKPFIKPVLSYKTKIIQIKDISSGYIGYGCSYQVTRPMRIAILPVGYYEGYERGLSSPNRNIKNEQVGNAHVLISGKKCPIVGRISMNMTIVDISKIKNNQIKELDEAVLIGKQGDLEITVSEIANFVKSINYEIVTRIPEHIPRYYI